MNPRRPRTMLSPRLTTAALRASRLVCLCLMLAACREGAAPVPAAGAATSEAGKGQAASSATPWVRARPAEGLSLLEAPARVLSPPSSAAAVVPPFRARVVGIHVQAGQSVPRGAPLLDVVMPEVIRAAGAHVAATTRLQAYEGRKAQLEQLRGEGLVRLADLAEAVTKVAEARADQQAALGTLRSANVEPGEAGRLLSGSGALTLKSPIAGVIVAVNATLGETHDNTDDPLLRIIGPGDSPPRIEARLGSGLVQTLPADARYSFSSAAGTLQLKLVGSAPVVDPRDGSTPCWFSPLEGSPPPLPQGLSGKLQVRLSDGGYRDGGAGGAAGGAVRVVTVPTRAVALQDGQTLVLRRQGSQIVRVPVTVLATSGADALVRGALSPGDEVAAEASLASATDATPAAAPATPAAPAVKGGTP